MLYTHRSAKIRSGFSPSTTKTLSEACRASVSASVVSVGESVDSLDVIGSNSIAPPCFKFSGMSLSSCISVGSVL